MNYLTEPNTVKNVIGFNKDTSGSEGLPDDRATRFLLVGGKHTPLMQPKISYFLMLAIKSFALTAMTSLISACSVS